VKENLGGAKVNVEGAAIIAGLAMAAFYNTLWDCEFGLQTELL